MNNEKKILEILGQIQSNVSGLKQDVSELKQGLDKLETKMDEGFEFLESCVNETAKDIQILVKQHETEYHSA